MSETDEWREVATLAQVQEDTGFPVKIGDKQIALYRLGGRVYAIGDICTHEYAQLSQGFAEAGTIECPLHQATFDIASGKCLTGPATIDLDRYAVRIEGNNIFVRTVPIK
jgi:3-phenylpropionate/trans-cinnamate dioxygenase ferredoxin subunit